VDNSGYHAIRNERTKLDLLGGLDVSREFFEGNDNDRTSLEAQLGQTLDHRLTPRLSLTEQLFFFRTSPTAAITASTSTPALWLTLRGESPGR
jgi:hypothetical protein